VAYPVAESNTTLPAAQGGSRSLVGNNRGGFSTLAMQDSRRTWLSQQLNGSVGLQPRVSVLRVKVGVATAGSDLLVHESQFCLGDILLVVASRTRPLPSHTDSNHRPVKAANSAFPAVDVDPRLAPCRRTLWGGSYRGHSRRSTAP